MIALVSRGTAPPRSSEAIFRENPLLSALARLLFIAAFATFATGAFAQAPIRIVIPADRGSDWDQAGRALGTAMLAARAATGVDYENRGGANGTLGLAHFAKTSRGDASALLFGGQDMVAAAEIDRAATRVQDVIPLARLAVSHYVVYVPADSPHRTIAALAKAFKSDPAALVWDVGAPGSPEHLLVAYIARMVGADAAKVRTLAGARDAGSPSAGIGRLRDLADAIKAGRIRALAVSSPRAMGGIASLKEQGIDVAFGNWHGLFAAPGLKPSQRDELLERVKAATQTPAWTALLQERGWTPVYMHGSDYARFIDEESRSLGYLAKSLGLRK